MMSQLLEFAGNHPLLIAGIVAAWLAVMFYEIRLKSQGFSHVSTADAVRLINKGAVVIDVRKPEDFSAGHIVNAKNIEYDALVKDEKFIGKYKNKVVLTVCNNGVSSNRAAGELRKSGLAQTFSIRGGLAGWRNEKMPLEK
jgi:rhodanese-related sulfurtransferase